ncbi:MAG: radical SAM family heme chaperone HemW [Candidatus Omnitrophota bacterium]
MSGLYIHIPFCRSKCPYCDFYSVGYEYNLASRYIRAISKQIKELHVSPETIYIGGGTPTVLPLITLKILFNKLKVFINKADEITVEANPESIDGDKLKYFLDSGVNRISIGVQSFNQRKLTRLGRPHSGRQARDSVFYARKKGFMNISIDLIFGVEAENLNIWKDDLKISVDLPIEHISAYSLAYERGAQLSRAAAAKKVIPLDDKKTADMYKLTLSYLPAKGFTQYEVSNFSKRGYACRHNLNCWENNPYTGLGASAVSYACGVRERNVSKLEQYINMAKKGIKPVESSERLSALKRAKETAALKIRTKEGIDFRKFKDKTGFDILKIRGLELSQLAGRKLCRWRFKNGKKIGIFPTRRGFLFCDTLSSSML